MADARPSHADRLFGFGFTSPDDTQVTSCMVEVADAGDCKIEFGAGDAAHETVFDCIDRVRQGESGDLEKEKSALSAVKDAAAAAMSGFDTDIEADEAMLQHGAAALTANQLNAVRARLSEKKCLRSTMSVVDDAVEALADPAKWVAFETKFGSWNGAMDYASQFKTTGQ